MSRNIVTVFGRQGSGKSTLLARCMPHMRRPLMVLDTMSEFGDGLQFEGPDHLRRYLIRGGPNASGLYVCNVTSDAGAEGFFSLLCTLQAPCTVIVDEASKFCNPNWIQPDLARIINYGRHWDQSLICAARRSPEIHRDVTAQSNAIISFRQTEPRDVKRLAEMYSEAEHLNELDHKKYEFMCFGDWEELPFAPVLRAGPRRTF